MDIVELVPKSPTIPTQLAVRKEGLQPSFALPGSEPPPAGTTILSNFKPWLSLPEEPHPISTRRADGKFDQLVLTGQLCIDAYARLLRAALPPKRAGAISDKTIIRISEPAFSDAKERKAYQGAVEQAARKAQLGRVEFMREPDAVFEYFRLYRRELDAASTNPINVLIIDFGGGTCNISAVQTTKGTGTFVNRYVADPLAAVAPHAGGLYIDLEILARAMTKAGLASVVTAGKQTIVGQLFEDWRARHSSAAEALKIAVSTTGSHLQCTVPIDGVLSKECGGRTSVDVDLNHETLAAIVASHWNRRDGIKTKIDEVVAKLPERGAKILHQKPAAGDARAMVTDIILAGGSSQLPGFRQLVEKHFETARATIHVVGKEFAFAVAGGMAFHELVRAKALRDARSTTPSPQDAGLFVPALPDDLEFRWRAGHEDAFSRDELYPATSSTTESLLQVRESVIQVPRSKNPFVTDVKGNSRFQFQVVYAGDQHANKNAFSDRRLNVGENKEKAAYATLSPADVARGEITLRRQVIRDQGRLTILLELVRPGAELTVLQKWRIPLEIERARTDLASREPLRPAVQSALSAQPIDVLCLDFGTTNTALIDLRQGGPIAEDKFKVTNSRATRPVVIRSFASSQSPTARASAVAPIPPSLGTKPVAPEPRPLVEKSETTQVKNPLLVAEHAPGQATLPAGGAVAEEIGVAPVQRTSDVVAARVLRENVAAKPLIPMPAADEPAQRKQVADPLPVTPNANAATAASLSSSASTSPPAMGGDSPRAETGTRVDAHALPTPMPAVVAVVRADAPDRAHAARPVSSAPKALPGDPFAGTEKEFIDYFEGYCRASSFTFPRWLLESTYLAFKTRPFLVLSGPSGVGKSALSRLFAESIGCSQAGGDTIRVAIEAHWTDGRHLFGRLSPDGTPIETEFLTLLRRAVDHPNRQYHVLLDEMNLAHVEYYFAQLLSAMEGDHVLRLHELGGTPLALPRYRSDTELVFFTGTINVDETTQTLSDKVVDRAAIIEVDAEAPPERIAFHAQPPVATQRFHVPIETIWKWRQLEPELAVPAEARELWQILALPPPVEDVHSSDRPSLSASFRLGRRVLRDLTVFVEYATRLGGGLNRQSALDQAIKQRVLPKLRGDMRIYPTLRALERFLKKHECPESLRRLERMLDILERDEFVSFWA